MSMRTRSCTDRVVGDILSGWRYDISGITPEMRQDYEQHLADCPYCRSRQRLHRTIDVVLIASSTVAIAAFLVALAVIHKVHPWQHLDLRFWQRSVVLSMQAAAATGLFVSLVAWLLVAVTTPAPSFLTEIAITQAKVIQERIPEELRERLMRNVA